MTIKIRIALKKWMMGLLLFKFFSKNYVVTSCCDWIYSVDDWPFDNLNLTSLTLNTSITSLKPPTHVDILETNYWTQQITNTEGGWGWSPAGLRGLARAHLASSSEQASNTPLPQSRHTPVDTTRCSGGLHWARKPSASVSGLHLFRSRCRVPSGRPRGLSAAVQYNACGGR